MTTVVVLPWSYGSRPATPRPEPRAPAAARRLSLRLLLERDERVRPRPPITLPHLDAGHPFDPSQTHAPTPTPADPPPPAPIEIATVLEAVARHFDVPVGALIGQRCRSGERPIPLIVAAAIAKSVTGATYPQVEAAMDAGAGMAWAAGSKVRHLRTVDPDLARRIAEIEHELGVVPA